MRIMINCLICGIGLSVLSCSTSKQFDFNSAYKFSTYNYQKKIHPGPTLEVVPQLYASTKFSIDNLESKPAPVIIDGSNKPSTVGKEALSKKQKKEFRRQFRREIKRVRAELKNHPPNQTLKSTRELESAQGINEKIFIGILVGGAGLLLLILDIASPLGVLAFVVGLGFVVWGFIEKGSFS